MSEQQQLESESENDDEWVGERVNSYDGRRFVTGHGEYVDDIETSDMLYACFVRSEHASATLDAIDTDEAEAHPGVELDPRRYR